MLLPQVLGSVAKTGLLDKVVLGSLKEFRLGKVFVRIQEGHGFSILRHVELVQLICLLILALLIVCFAWWLDYLAFGTLVTTVVVAAAASATFLVRLDAASLIVVISTFIVALILVLVLLTILA